VRFYSLCLSTEILDYPSYELYSEGLRRGLYDHSAQPLQLARQLRIIVDKERKVVQSIVIPEDTNA
jgi:hypothetical protein